MRLVIEKKACSNFEFLKIQVLLELVPKKYKITFSIMEYNSFHGIDIKDIYATDSFTIECNRTRLFKKETQFRMIECIFLPFMTFP
jgi:hypothetical protein